MEDANLPPVVQILKEEKFFDLEKPEDLMSKLSDSGLVKDLKNQAEWSCRNFSYADRQELEPQGDFLITPSSSMNPFDSRGKCSNERCYNDFIDKFAKIVGLYVDRVILTDTFTSAFLGEKKFSFQFYVHFCNQIRALRIFLPFIDKGIISFANPSHAYCENCYRKHKGTITNAAASLADASKNDLTYYFDYEEKEVLVINSPLYSSNEDHPPLLFIPLKEVQLVKIKRALESKNKRKGKQQAFEIINDIYLKGLESAVESVLFDVKLSQHIKSVFTAGTRLESLYLKELDNNCPDINNIESWENLRAIDLPYIKELSVDEILFLREEAQNSLPKFRQLIGQGLNKGSSKPSDKPIFDVVTELKEQLNEVEVEINSLSLTKEKRYRFGMAGLALSFVIYSLYSGQPILTATSVAGLLSTLAHLRSNERECDAKIAQIHSKPAFTLFKAKEILQSKKEL